MSTARIRLSAALIALLLTIPVMASAADAAPVHNNLVAKAEAFVQNMAKGDFTAAEADFTAQMQQAAPADKLQGIWQALVLQGGAYQKIAGTKTVNQGGYASVIVNTQFKNQTIGLLVTFDSSGKIGGMHLVTAF
ncbi:MAG: DUF3887 domain-containing protein [Gammaproteobacteria bacterium]|nr:DUF3887 domain-containing protein [Gammaproteobacteria bacterium]